MGITTSDTQYQYIGDRGADGTIVGYDSSGPLGFFGKTPTTRQTAPTALVTTVAVSVSSASFWCFAGSTQANAITTAVNSIRTALVNLGLMA